MAKEQVDLQMDLDNEPEVEFVFEEESNDEVVTQEQEQAAEETVEQEPSGPNAVDALKAELEALKGSLGQQVPKDQGGNKELVAALREALGKDTGDKEPALDLEAFKKQYFVDPAKSTDQMIDLKTKKFNDMISAMEKKFDRMQQKVAVISNEGTRSVFNKYSDEVESLVDQGHSYDNALLMTKAKHLDEFTQEAVEKALADAAEKAKPKVEVPFTNGNIPPTAKRENKKVITQAQKQVMQALADQSAGIYNLKDDAEFLYNYAKKKGLI